jgi:RNA 2',3'-cyclic 3'-phosphodiesterase
MIEVAARPDQPVDAPAARLFLALCPEEPVRAALATHADAWRWTPDAARYAPADWHVTLHFIGPVPRQRIDELRAALAVAVAPFELRFGEPALWPHGLAVLRPMAVPAGLQRLHADLGRALRRLGLRIDERPYRPHITLARHAAQAKPPSKYPAFGWQVQGYALMESTGLAGQRYRVLQAYGPA